MARLTFKDIEEKLSRDLDLSRLEITESEFKEELESCIKHSLTYTEIKENFEDFLDDEPADRYMVSAHN